MIHPPSPEEVVAVHKAIKMLKSAFKVEELDSSMIDFEKFELFAHYEFISQYRAYYLTRTKRPAIVSFTEVEHKVNTKRGFVFFREYQVWCAVNLKSSYGNILIRHETLRDKVNELFYREELEFEDDKEFCERFFVLTDNKPNAAKLFTGAVRHLINSVSLKNLEIEIRNSALIIGSKSNVVPEDALILAQFAYKLANSDM